MEINIRITKHRKKENGEYVFLTEMHTTITSEDIEAAALKDHIDNYSITDTDEWTYEATIDEIKIS